MKRLAKIAFLYIPIFIVILFVVCGFIATKRVYLQSPDGSKTITIYSIFFSDKFYNIPYKYTSLLPPKDNYCTEKIVLASEFVGDIINNDKLINWYPSDGYYLKMTGDCIINKLQGNIKIGTEYSDIMDKTDIESEKINKYDEKYVKHIIKQLDKKNKEIITMSIIIAFLIFIVEPVLCLVLLLWAILKKIGYYWPLRDDM
jgi:hypothetical protein